MFLWATCLTALFVTSATGRIWETLTARYSACPFSGFYSLPVKLNEAISQLYYKVDKLEQFNVTVHCKPHEPRLCLLFDQFANIAGVRVTFVDKDLNRESLRLYGIPIPYNYSEVAMFSKTVTDDIVGWSAYVLFASPVMLPTGRRIYPESIADGIFAKIDGQWVEVSRDECTVNQQGFIRGKCKFGRGTHYFHGTSLDLNCDQYQPFFATYDGKEMVGFGFAGIGSWSKGQYKPWFERKPFFGGYKSLVPDESVCLMDWAKLHEFSVIHFYLVNKPYFIGCWPDMLSRKCDYPDERDQIVDDIVDETVDE